MAKFVLDDKTLVQHFLISAICLFLVLFVNYSLGAFNTSEYQLSEQNSAIAMPIMAAVGWFGSMLLFKRTQHNLSAFLISTKASKYVDAVLDELEFQRTLYLRISVIIGVLFSAFYLLIEILENTNIGALTLFLSVNRILFWSSSALLSIQLFMFTRYTVNNFFDSDTINNHSTSSFRPISNLVVTNTIVSTTFISLVPIFWLNKQIILLEIFVTSTVFIVITCFLITPLIKTYALLNQRKESELKKLNHSLRERIERAKLSTNGTIFCDKNAVRDMVMLIEARRQITATSAWPLNVSQSIRLSVLSLCIPMAWTAGVLIEHLVLN